ncbi:MAG: metalloregulator ArsR/SmtB family transcription factor [Elusimicrobiales bacterium]
MTKQKMFYDSQAQVIKALAHPTRLLLVNRLARQAVCVCDLTATAGCDISTVSLHLNLLRKAGLVCSEKKGNRVYYRLLCPCIMEFLGCIARVVRDNARRQARVASGWTR